MGWKYLVYLQKTAVTVFY